MARPKGFCDPSKIAPFPIEGSVLEQKDWERLWEDSLRRWSVQTSKQEQRTSAKAGRGKRLRRRDERAVSRSLDLARELKDTPTD